MPKVEIEYGDRKDPYDGQKRIGLGLNPGDAELLDMICDYLGCSQSEAIRSSIRIMASTLLKTKR